MTREEFRNALCKLCWLDPIELEQKNVNKKSLQYFKSHNPARAYLYSDDETIDIIWPMISCEKTSISEKEPKL